MHPRISVIVVGIGLLVAAFAIFTPDGAALAVGQSGLRDRDEIAAPRDSRRDDSVPSCEEDTRNLQIEFDRKNFRRSTRINNKYLPLIPGTEFTLSGETSEGPHVIKTTVTDVTKTIDGVRAIIVWDRDFRDGKLVEEELALLAQDDDGNVWRLGEYPEEYEDGDFIGAPSAWLSGVNKARAGIDMPNDPELDQPPYSQGTAPDIEFADCGQVIGENESLSGTSVPGITQQVTAQGSTFSVAFTPYCASHNCRGNILVIEEWDAFEPDARQIKYYAPFVGNVRVGAIDDPEAEVLELVDVQRLRKTDYDAARKRVLELDKRAYTVAKDVWKGTPRATLN